MTDPSSGGSLLWPSPLTMVEKIFLGVVLRITLRAFRLGGVRCRRSNWFQTVGRAVRATEEIVCYTGELEKRGLRRGY